MTSSVGRSRRIPTLLTSLRRQAELRFTVHRPASAEVSPCCHRSSSGDVARGVHIGVARPGGAGLAFKYRLALAVSDSHIPTRRASLRRVRGRDLLDPTIRLVLQTTREQTPPASEDAPVEAPFLGHLPAGLLHGAPGRSGHRPRVQGFDPDRVEAPCDRRGGLLAPVLASVGLTRIQLGDRALGAGTPFGTALSTGQPLLQHPQPLGLSRAQARDVQQFAGGQRRRHHNPAVDTDHGTITWTNDGIRDVGKCDVPSARPVAGDPVRLHPLRHRARQPEAHPTDLGNPHTPNPTVQPLDMMRFDRDLAKTLVQTSLPPCRTTVSPSEEVRHRLCEIAQRLLLHIVRPSRKPVVLSAGRSQLSTLLVVSRHAAPGLPMPLLLNSQVPHIPGIATMLSQLHRLPSGRKQPVARHPRNISATTDKSAKGEAAFPALAQARVHTATIQ